MIRTFVDAGVLIALARGTLGQASRALALLEDPSREFVSSAFVRLEVMPKAAYHRMNDELAVYEDFFSSRVREWARVDEELVAGAYREACEYGLSAADALHVAAAVACKADELVTTEVSTKPLHRTASVAVVQLDSD
jgi:predicted nucleic acid-binding protein